AETAPDLIILNLTMPGLDGFEVLKRLRAHPATTRVPILVLSGATEADAQAAIQLGADDFLAKPVSPRMLVSAIHALLGRRPSG
ncbi:MAG: response regulator transcription factor, partial [Candidatus Binatia bacterium]